MWVTKGTQIFAVFGYAKAKIVQFMTRDSFINDFRAHSSEILSLSDSRFTRLFRELPVYVFYHKHMEVKENTREQNITVG